MSKGLVAKATSDDPTKVVTGLQLKNLSDATMDPNECEVIREALLGRLEDSSPFVKFKALRVLKYVAQHGKAEFRLELSRGAGNGLIKDHLNYRGTPHETRGDAPNQAVREEAKAALAAIFGAGAAETAHTARDNIVGFGSGGAVGGSGGGAGGSGGSGGAGAGGIGGDSMSGGYGAGTYGGNISINVSKSGNMIGFGNPAFENQKESKGFLDKMKDVVVGASGGENPAPFRPYAGAGPYQGAGAGYGPGAYAPSSSPVTYQPAHINHSTVQYSTAAPEGGRKKGQVGGGWGSETAAAVPRAGGEDPYASSGSHGGQSSFGSAAAAAANAAANPPRAHSGGGDFEKKLVADVVQPSGVRALPTAQELSAFVAKCQALDNYDIALLLDSKLASDSMPASQLKALAVLDAMLSAGSPTADGVVEYYREHQAANTQIIAHEQSATPAVRKLVLAVLQKTGLRAVQAAPAPAAAQYAAAAAAAPTKQAEAPNLFDISSVPQASSAPAASSAAAVAETGGLFSQLAIKPAAAPAPNSAAAIGDMMSMLSTPSTAPPQPQPQPQPVQHQQPVAASGDPFSGLFGTAPAPQSQPLGSDPYAALLKSKQQQNSYPQVQAANNNNPYGALASSFPASNGGGGGGGGGVNFLSNTSAHSNSAAKNYNFTVTAARQPEAASPAKPNGAASYNGPRDIAIDPFANAFAQPITSSAKPALGGGAGAGGSTSSASSSSGFGFIGSDKSDPFGSLVQLK